MNKEQADSDKRIELFRRRVMDKMRCARTARDVILPKCHTNEQRCIAEGIVRDFVRQARWDNQLVLYLVRKGRKMT